MNYIKISKIKALKLLDIIPIHLPYIIFSVVYVALAMHLPVSIYALSVHDDALFISNAYQLVQGKWLGSYSEFTLAKGVGFPVFLAINAFLGIPVTLLTAILYLFACGLFVNTLHKLGLGKYLLLIIFFIILFHPNLFQIRVIRDNIYPALTLIILSGVIRLVCVSVQEKLRIIKIVPYGLVFGLFWLTREEGVWIVPGILLLVFIKCVQLIKQNISLKEIFNRIAIFSLAAMLPIIMVASINYHEYGKFETVDFKGVAFTRALQSLNSVQAGPALPYLPVSFGKRQEIYKVSPSFLQLRSFLEVEGKGWASEGCKIYPTTCGDYAGGWFAWALRNAVATKGYYESPVRAADFYNRITKEIETACDNGLITCKSSPIPLMPNITVDQLKEFPGKIYQALELAMVQSPAAETGGGSLGAVSKLNKIRFFLGNPKTTLAPSEELIGLKGWFYSASKDWIKLVCSSKDKEIINNIERISSPDIVKHFNNPDANFQRFSFNVLEADDCKISLESLPASFLEIDSIMNKKNGSFKVGANSTIYFDEILRVKSYFIQSLPLKFKNTLSSLYKLVVPVIVFLGALAYAVSLIVTLVLKKRFDNISIVSTMLWCLFFSRVFLLVLVDISSFPAINTLYMQPAFPVLCLAALLSMQLIFSRNKSATR